ncbi:MAG: hypothetical protein ACKOC6_12180 [bacterium]
MRPSPTPSAAPLTLREVLATWAPLAGSWLLMGLELPAVSAVMARLPESTVSLAAYGGVVFPLALLIESPILMLLTASTALARDARSYRIVRRFMWVAGGALTVLHAAIAFTPLFDVLASAVIAVPEAVREPARMGLRIMLPWSMAIAYRRTQQGVLIRFDRARAVTVGTMIRLGTLATVLALGAAYGHAPAIVVGTTAVASAVVAEAVFARLAVGPLVRGALADAPAPAGDPLTMRSFLRFYVPLMLTPLLHFLGMPLAASAMSRMPLPLESLAVWPVLSGAAFTGRSVGFAYNEGVVALLERTRPWPMLRRFAWTLGLTLTTVLLVGAVTPLGAGWFRHAAGLSDPLADMAWRGLPLLVPMGLLTVAQSLLQGVLVHARATRAITESMAVLLVATGAVLTAGIAYGRTPGLPFAAAALTAGGLAQVAWLAWRSRAARRALVAR